MGKQRKNRRHQLRAIKERRQRYQAKIPQSEFSFGRFLLKHLTEIIFVLCFTLAIVFVYTKRHPKNIYEIETLTSSVAQKNINSLKNSYPLGFRVFAIVKDEILPLNIDTLPKELEIEWGTSKLILLNRNEVRFNIGPTTYADKLLALSWPVKLPRREGKSSQSLVINNIELTVELIAEYNTGIFLALGFKRIGAQ